MPLKLDPVTFFCRSCSGIAYKHSTSVCLSAIRSVDMKLFGAQAGLHFRGIAPLLIKALRRVQALSPSATWYCLLKPKQPNNNKHLCCTACLSLISCRGVIFSGSQPLRRDKRTEPPPTHIITPILKYSPTLFRNLHQYVSFI